MRILVKRLVNNIINEDYNNAGKNFDSLLSEKVMTKIEEMKMEVSKDLLGEVGLKRRAASGKSLSLRKKMADRRKRGLSPTTGKRIDPKKSRNAKITARRSRAARKRGMKKRQRTNRRFK